MQRAPGTRATVLEAKAGIVASASLKHVLYCVYF